MVIKAARSPRALVGGIACLFSLAILVSVAIESGGRTKATPPLAAAAAAAVESLMSSEGSSSSSSSSSRDRPIDRMNSDPFFATKRRVPNGPDPIHNRRAGKLGRPPGRA